MSTYRKVVDRLNDQRDHAAKNEALERLRRTREAIEQRQQDQRHGYKPEPAKQGNG